MRETARWRAGLGDVTAAEVDALLRRCLLREEARGGIHRVVAELNRSTAATHRPADPSGQACRQCAERWPCSHLRMILSDFLGPMFGEDQVQA